VMRTDGIPNGLDDSGNLVPERVGERTRRGQPLPVVNVRVADPCSGDANENVMGADGWRWHVVTFEWLAEFDKLDGLHCVLLGRMVLPPSPARTSNALQSRGPDPRVIVTPRCGGQEGGTMPETLMAYCGLQCSGCSAYIAKRTDDDALRARTAKAWSAPGFSIATDDVNCDGCRASEGRFKFCQTCEVRTCAATRNIETCATCDEYACEKLEQLYTHVGPEARANLEALRTG